MNRFFIVNVTPAESTGGIVIVQDRAFLVARINANAKPKRWQEIVRVWVYCEYTNKSKGSPSGRSRGPANFFFVMIDES